MLRDFRFALRLAGRRPLLSAAIVTTLALGIGSTTALFAVVRAALFQSIPFRDAERLAILWLSDPSRSQAFIEVSYPDFLDWQREASGTFDELVAIPSVNFEATLTGVGQEPRRVRGRSVTVNFFEALGAQPRLGRTFIEGEGRRSAARVVVLGHGLWQELFGGRSDAIGKTITLNGTVLTVVGVMPPAFQYPAGAQYWYPLEQSVPEGATAGRTVYWLLAVGRLREGVTLEAARAAMDVIVRRVDRQHLNEDRRRIVIEPLTEQILGGIRQPLVALFGAVVLLLLVGCTNVAGLLLTRSIERRREVAVRTALGASRLRLVRQTLIETLPLAAAGAAAGLALSRLIVAFLASGRGIELPPGVVVADDYLTFGVAVGLALIATTVCGMAPALEAIALGRRSLGQRLRETPGAGGGRHGRARDLVVVAQLALAVALGAGAMLMGRSFLALSRSDFGYDPRQVLALEVTQPDDLEESRSFYAAALERIRALPGVRAAAGVFLRPLWSTIGFDGIYVAEGQTEADGKTNPHINVEGATPGYFETMRIRLVRGRDFTEADDERAPGRIIVSESLAHRAWPGSDGLGKRLRMPMGQDSPYHQQWLTVVGVAADARYREIEAARFDLYLPYRQFNAELKHIVVRAEGDPARLAPSVRAAIRSIDPTRLVDDVRTLEDIVDGALRTRRVTAQILAALAATALLLALLGVHTTMAHAVTLIRRELAIRLALGAEPTRLRREILLRGLRLAAVALVPGLAASIAIGRAVAALLYGIPPTDLPALSAASAGIAVAALAGCYVPALRASRTDPVAALRQE